MYFLKHAENKMKSVSKRMKQQSLSKVPRQMVENNSPATGLLRLDESDYL